MSDSDNVIDLATERAKRAMRKETMLLALGVVIGLGAVIWYVNRRIGAIS